MKNLSIRVLAASLFITIYTGSAFGQWGPGQPQIDKTSFNLQREIWLTEDSERKEILLPVTGPIVKFVIRISSRVMSGELTIEIYDPTGEKQGNYSIDNQISSRQTPGDKNEKRTSKETVNGNLEKSIEYPINGNWKIIIIPKNATGELGIESNQMSTKQIPDKPNKR